MSNLKSGQAERQTDSQGPGCDSGNGCCEPQSGTLSGSQPLRLQASPPSARAEGQIALEVMLKNIRLEPQSFVWRNNLGLRGLMSLRVAFGQEGGSGGADSGRTQT